MKNDLIVKCPKCGETYNINEYDLLFGPQSKIHVCEGDDC